MPEKRRGRRAFLGAVAAGVGTAQLGTAAAEGASRSCSRSGAESESGGDQSDVDTSFLSASDSEQSSVNSQSTEEPTGISVDTPLDISVAEMDISLEISAIDSGNEGPTAFIVGGVHGDEEAGYLAAEEMLDWKPDAGKLVVLPRSNPVAIENDSRATDYGDLNRNFDADGPTTPLAKAIWGAIEQTDPDVLLSLHESRGIYDSSSSVGQAVFHSPTEEARDAARMGINQANKSIRQRSIMFDLGHVSPPGNLPSGLLTERTTYTTGIPSFIVETYEGVSLDVRVRWQKMITRGILDHFDFY